MPEKVGWLRWRGFVHEKQWEFSCNKLWANNWFRSWNMVWHPKKPGKWTIRVIFTRKKKVIYGTQNRPSKSLWGFRMPCFGCWSKQNRDSTTQNNGSFTNQSVDEKVSLLRRVQHHFKSWLDVIIEACQVSSYSIYSVITKWVHFALIDLMHVHHPVFVVT